MSNSTARYSHADLATPHEMYDDCCAAGANVPGLERAARAAVRPAPSIRYEDYPSEVTKPEVEVDEAAVRLAAALHLHLD